MDNHLHRNTNMPSARICGWLMLLAALILLSALSASVLMSDRDIIVASYWGLQTKLFIQLNAGMSDWPLFWQNVTELGDAFVLLPFLSFYILRRPQVWVAFFAAIPLTAMLSVSLKQLVSMPRPAAVLSHDRFYILGETLAAHNSFPSGHTITVFAIITVITGLSISVKRHYWYWAMGGFLFACLVALSRLAVGAHWPVDVAVGACLGVVGGSSGLWVVQRYAHCWRWLERPMARKAAGYTMILWGGLLLIELLIGERGDVTVSWLASFCATTAGVFLLFHPGLLRVATSLASWYRIDTVQLKTSLSRLREVKQLVPGMVGK